MEGRQNTVQPQGQEAEVERVKAILLQAIEGELQQMAELFVSKKDHELFGRTEFQLRDLVLQAGSRAMEAVLEDRKKGGTKAAAWSARNAKGMPDLWHGGSGR